jgi:hypothetical protein
MSSPKEASKETGKENSKESSKYKSRVVKFAQTEADQTLWQALELALSQQPQSSFSDLCKRALHQYLVVQSQETGSDPSASIPSVSGTEVSALQRQVLTLQKQIRALQLQITKLEGAIGMQRSLSLSSLEQQLVQLEQQMMHQTHQMSDRIRQLESQNHSQQNGESSAPEPEEPIALDPVLTRLVPLLEDF